MLAQRAGGPYVADPGRLVREMRPSVLGMYLAQQAIDPQDENRADRRAAMVAAAIFAGAGAKKRDGSMFSEADFMPYLELQRDPEAVERELSARIRATLLNITNRD